MKIKARKKTLFKAFLLTSLFWISLDVFFYIHKQVTTIDVDVVVINGQEQQVRQLRSTHSTRPSFRVPNQEHVEIISEESQHESQHESHDQQVESELFPELVIPGLGHEGLKANLPDRLQNLSQVLFNNHSFDSVLSDHISMNRKLPDASGQE